MKTTQQVIEDFRQFNGPGLLDHKVMAQLLLDIRDLMLVYMSIDPSSTSIASEISERVAVINKLKGTASKLMGRDVSADQKKVVEKKEDDEEKLI